MRHSRLTDILLSITKITGCFLLIVALSYGAGVGITQAVAADAATCLNQTPDEGQCKDCCDCLTEAAARKSCRDACIAKAQSDDGFSENNDLITVDTPSVLGPYGDYTVAVGMSSEQECKTYCNESEELGCGDRKYCRDACNDAFGGSDGDPDPPPDVNPPSPDQDSGYNISIDQAISDDAQMKTIAFSGLAFLTGDSCADTFFPPGKVSDFFGFQYMRDITPNGFGHNTEFAGRISDSVLSILTDAQVQLLVDLANEQAALIEAYGYKRFVLIDAFRRLLENDLPAGTTGLDIYAVKAFSADLYEIDGEISFARARVIGGIVSAFSEAQKNRLAELYETLNTLFESAGEGGSIADSEWPQTEPVDLSGLEVMDGRVLVSTYATQLYSWYLGSITGDTYFCPERHGTYFGSFYMKDIPPLTAKEAVSIDTNLTAEMGSDFLGTLDNSQATLITGLVDIQKTALNNIVITRQAISVKLRLFMSGETVDESEVLALIRQYGEYDGEIVYSYATRFATVGDSLTDSQASALMSLRLAYYERFLDYQNNPHAYDCEGAWLYSSKVGMPEIMDTDFLFDGSESLVGDGAEITLISDIFKFGEGPAADSFGNVYLSDVTDNKIYKLSSTLDLTIFRENTGGANGLFFDPSGNLLACEGTGGEIVAMDHLGTVTMLADTYNGLRFNEPNDLWVSPSGGLYFTDPVYFGSEVQDGEHVYYLSADRSTQLRVIDDMTRPNGIIGSPDGTMLYVTDHGAGETYQYTINTDGTLNDKQLFTPTGGDGMTMDSHGNVYLCADSIYVYDPDGHMVETILVPERPTNVCFGGQDGKTLFITTRTSLYQLKMNVSGNIYTPGTDDTGGETDSDGNDDDDTSTGTPSGSGSGGCFIDSLFMP